MLFARALEDRLPWTFVLQDYNDIFALSTVPNLFLTWYVKKYAISQDPNDIEVTDELKQNFLTDLKTLDIRFELLIAGWGKSLTVLSLIYCSAS